ncbi:hypothetical protein [Methanoculleus horonobensis]|uniref:hypothetical protein n=1 Tax=Methanoculleus horonobensis TaxID=528314 RepID=UPI000830E5CA|nr:hypothetical protein [Methanoculleus horonobensis]MDD3070334.1 hypothetical protein [Methanoculleus horonobensis]MDD4252089.1 hypothetical protein [Methanoculleus horonobensis]MDK2915844.1 hypothetical protein [Euryarchaeota archaeon]
MGERKKESIAEVLVSRVVGIVVFLIVLGILNILAGAYVRIPIFLQVVEFLNANLGLLILISVIFLVGDLFGALPLPLNLPGPIFGAFGAVLLVIFIARFFLFFAGITDLEFFFVFEKVLTLPVYLLVFIIALIAGYIGLFTNRM